MLAANEIDIELDDFKDDVDGEENDFDGKNDVDVEVEHVGGDDVEDDADSEDDEIDVEKGLNMKKTASTLKTMVVKTWTQALVTMSGRRRRR